LGELAGLLVSQGIGVASSATNTYVQNQALRQQSNFQRSQAATNLKWNQMQQEDVMRRGNLAASRKHQETNRLVGAQRAAGAASGIDPTTGSVKELGIEAQALGQMDAATIQANAYRQALGLRAEQADIISQTRMNRIATRSQMNQSIISSGMKAAQAATAAGYYADRYQGLGGKPTHVVGDETFI
jgi:hypothetical protein